MNEKKSYFEVLGVGRQASQSEVDAAYEAIVYARKRQRRSTADVVAAHSVLSDPVLRRAHELSIFGHEAGEKLEAAVEAVQDRLPDIDWAEVRREAWQTTLKTTVLVSGATAKAADLTAGACRRLQSEAAKRLSSEA